MITRYTHAGKTTTMTLKTTSNLKGPFALAVGHFFDRIVMASFCKGRPWAGVLVLALAPKELVAALRAGIVSFENAAKTTNKKDSLFNL